MLRTTYQHPTSSVGKPCLPADADQHEERRDQQHAVGNLIERHHFLKLLCPLEGGLGEQRDAACIDCSEQDGCRDRIEVVNDHADR